jgi:hypothetical protein
MKYTLLILFILFSGACFGQKKVNNSAYKSIVIGKETVTESNDPMPLIKGYPIISGTIVGGGTDSSSTIWIGGSTTTSAQTTFAFRYLESLRNNSDTCIKDTSEAYITAMACDSCKERLRIGYVVTDTCQQPIVITFLDIRKQPLPPRVTVIKYRRKNED